MALIKTQQEEARRPVKLSTVQCIICMENMKDLTATSCGRLDFPDMGASIREFVI